MIPVFGWFDFQYVFVFYFWSAGYQESRGLHVIFYEWIITGNNHSFSEMISPHAVMLIFYPPLNAARPSCIGTFAWYNGQMPGFNWLAEHYCHRLVLTNKYFPIVFIWARSSYHNRAQPFTRTPCMNLFGWHGNHECWWLLWYWLAWIRSLFTGGNWGGGGGGNFGDSYGQSYGGGAMKGGGFGGNRQGPYGGGYRGGTWCFTLHVPLILSQGGYRGGSQCY